MTPTFQFDETLNTTRVTITARVDGTEDRAAFSVCVQREQVQDFLRAFVVATRKAAANTTEKVLLGKRDRPLFVPDPQKKPKPSDDGSDDGSDSGSGSDSDSDSDDDDAYNEDGELVNSKWAKVPDPVRRAVKRMIQGKDARIAIYQAYLDNNIVHTDLSQGHHHFVPAAWKETRKANAFRWRNAKKLVEFMHWFAVLKSKKHIVSSVSRKIFVERRRDLLTTLPHEMVGGKPKTTPPKGLGEWTKDSEVVSVTYKDSCEILTPAESKNEVESKNEAVQALEKLGQPIPTPPQIPRVCSEKGKKIVSSVDLPL